MQHQGAKVRCIFTAQPSEIEVLARPEDLLQHGLSAADLADQIGKAHRLQPVGRVEQQPFAFQLILNNQGETARSIEELVISVKGNQPLLVRDVADVKVLHQDRVLSIGYEGKDAVVITIFRRVGGNTVTVSSGLQALLKKMNLPKGISATIVYNQADFVNTSIQNVRDAIFIGGLFSVLILLAFLRSWRATLISALAIPTTLASRGARRCGCTMTPPARTTTSSCRASRWTRATAA